MKPIRGKLILGAFVVLITSGDSLHAAWNNVFQVSCFRNRVSVSNFNDCCDPCPQPCPQPVCTTRYVQRCYYQPVTTYKRKISYQPVTTYRTSYYWEPCTSYRYSCCYDPCTCSYRQVAKKVTSYRLRSRCCPVTSYLQRCQLVPTTSYRRVTYYQAVTNCTDPCAQTSTQGTTNNNTNNTPITTEPPPSLQQQPGVGEQRSSQRPKVGEKSDTNSGTSRFPTLPDYNQPKSGSSSYRSAPRRPKVKLDKIVALPSHNVEGRLVTNDRYPRAEARVLFVSADRQGEQRTLTTNRDGQFETTLTNGNWLVYVRDDRTGRPVYQTKITVENKQVRRVSLVSR